MIQPTWGWLRNAAEQLGMALVDLFHRQPSRLFHQIDQAEVAGAEHDRRAAGGRAVDLLVASVRRRHRTAPRPGHGRPPRPARRRRRTPDAGAFTQRSLDEIVEAVAIALLEGRALGLAVVGEDDDLVGTRREATGRDRSGRTADRACAAPPSCRRARDPSDGRPRRSWRRSRRPRGGRASCPRGRRRRSGRG